MNDVVSGVPMDRIYIRLTEKYQMSMVHYMCKSWIIICEMYTIYIFIIKIVYNSCQITLSNTNTICYILKCLEKC